MFLFFLLMMMMIFSPLCLYVGVMCEDCQMMRKTASVPHGSTGRDGPLPTLHDPAMMMMTMMSDGTWPTSCSCSALLCSALEYPRVATCTSCNHLIRRHTHHTHTYSQHLATYLHYLHSQPNKTRKRREEFKVTTQQQQQVRTRYSRARLHYPPVPTTAQPINPRCPWYQETMIKASKRNSLHPSSSLLLPTTNESCN